MPTLLFVPHWFRGAYLQVLSLCGLQGLEHANAKAALHV
jgi:hypothetical protein